MLENTTHYILSDKNKHYLSDARPGHARIAVVLPRNVIIPKKVSRMRITGCLQQWLSSANCRLQAAVVSRIWHHNGFHGKFNNKWNGSCRRQISGSYFQYILTTWHLLCVWNQASASQESGQTQTQLSNILIRFAQPLAFLTLQAFITSSFRRKLK